MTEQTVTVAEAAEILSVSQRTIWAHIRAGRLTRLKDGQRTVISLQEVLNAASGSSEPIAYNPETHILIERDQYNKLLEFNKETINQLSEMGFRIGQLEAEKRQFEEKVRLLEDRRPWWKRMFA